MKDLRQYRNKTGTSDFGAAKIGVQRLFAHSNVTIHVTSYGNNLVRDGRVHLHPTCGMSLERL